MKSFIPRDESITVGTTSVEVSAEPSLERKALVITNTSTGGQVITLGFGKEAIASIGVVLYPTGAWAESIDSSYIPSQLRITAISSAAAGKVTIHERVE